MSEAVKMPALGESVTEGTVSQWLKQVGDTVEADEPLLEVSTDKVDSEVPAPCAGTILKILVEEDDTVDVGEDLCIIGDPSEGDDSSSDNEDAGQGESDSSEEKVEHPEEAGVPEGMETDDVSSDNPMSSEPSQSESSESSSDSDKESSGDNSGDDSGEGTEVTMPALGESVTEGTISSWLKAEGDHVEADEPLVEVSTDKVDSEVPSPVSGTLTKILAQEDDTVDVGSVIAIIGGSASSSSSSSKESEEEKDPKEEKPSSEESSSDKSDDSEDVPGGNIPSSVSKDGEKKVVQWAYPQASTGYPGTMTPEGQQIPKAPPIPQGAAMPHMQQDQKQEESAPPAPATPPQAEKAPSAPEKKSSESSSESVSGSYVTPIVRKLAKEKGVDLSQVTGTGVGGRIRKQDVLDAAKKAEEAPAPSQSSAPSQPSSSSKDSGTKPSASVPAVDTTKRGKTEKMSRLRQTIAKRMMESLDTAAQLTTVIEVDVTRIAALRNKAKNSFMANEGTKLTYLPFFIKAATEALKAHPKLNATINGKEVTYHDHEHIGIAVDTERGLMVPVIKDCGDLTIAGIAKHVNDLASRTRNQKVKPDELSGSTFTITNTGSGGALFDTPIINMPEVAILGVGTIVKRPMVIKDADGNDTIAIRSMVYLALSYDHQLVDGADAARYLMTVKKRLEDGDFDAEVGL